MNISYGSSSVLHSFYSMEIVQIHSTDSKSLDCGMDATFMNLLSMFDDFMLYRSNVECMAVTCLICMHTFQFNVHRTNVRILSQATNYVRHIWQLLCIDNERQRKLITIPNTYIKINDFETWISFLYIKITYRRPDKERKA